MATATQIRYPNKSRKVKQEVPSKKSHSTKKRMSLQLNDFDSKYDESYLVLPPTVKMLEIDRLNMLAGFVSLVENKNKIKNKAKAEQAILPTIQINNNALQLATSITSPTADIISPKVEPIEPKKENSFSQNLLPVLAFASSAGLLMAASHRSAAAVKSLATGYAVAIGSTALAAKAIDNVDSKNVERTKQYSQVLHSVGDSVLSIMISNALKGAIQSAVMTVAPALGSDIASRIANVNTFTLIDAAIYAKNYFFDRSGVLNKFDGQLTKSFGNSISRTLLSAVIAQSTGLLAVGFGNVGIAGYFLSYTLGRTLVDVYYDYWKDDDTKINDPNKQAINIAKEKGHDQKNKIDKEENDKSTGKATDLKEDLDLIKANTKAKPSLAKFLMQRLALNASVCAAGFLSPYAVSFASRTLPVLSSTILSSQIVTDLVNKIEGIDFKPVKDLLSKILHSQATAEVADKSIAAT